MEDYFPRNLLEDVATLLRRRAANLDLERFFPFTDDLDIEANCYGDSTAYPHIQISRYRRQLIGDSKYESRHIKSYGHVIVENGQLVYKSSKHVEHANWCGANGHNGVIIVGWDAGEEIVSGGGGAGEGSGGDASGGNTLVSGGGGVGVGYGTDAGVGGAGGAAPETVTHHYPLEDPNSIDQLLRQVVQDIRASYQEAHGT